MPGALPLTLLMPSPPNARPDPRVSEGAPAAPMQWTLETVYEAHGDFVWRCLRAIGVPDADLDDMTHEVFLVVHRKLAEFEGRAAITTWLFSIAQRVASDRRRRAHVRREQPTDPMPESADSDSASADDEMELKQRRAALDEILATMPDEQRVVFAFFELDGMPADEIASLVDCPVNTVYSRLRLARKHLERALPKLRARGVL